MMSIEHERLATSMDLELKWTKEILIEQNKHLSKLLEENSQLREDLREGIPLRDHFAGLAMQGFLAADYNDWDYEKLALTSYEQADAMLAERDKKDV
jgi:hypothetical protein